MKNLVEGITATIGLSIERVQVSGTAEGLLFAFIVRSTYLAVYVDKDQALVFHQTPLQAQGQTTRARKSLMDAICDGTFNSLQATCLQLKSTPDALVGELGEMWANACLLHEEAESFEVPLYTTEFHQLTPTLTLH